MFSRETKLFTRLLRVLLIGLLSGRCVGALAEDDDKKPEKIPPRIAMCVPLAVPIDSTTKMLVRGWGLEGAKEIRSSNPQLTFKVLSTAKAAIPNKQDAKQIGDTQVELEVTVAKDVQPGEVDLIIVQPDAESQPHKLLVGGDLVSGFTALLEMEPNDGFTQAQPIQIPHIVDGQVDGDGNVDVFSFELTDQQQIAIEVHAYRFGSNLDSILTVFDRRGSIVAVNDDAIDTKDSQIIATLAAGKYFVSLQDAHDRGGPAHPYRLTVKMKK